jgi:hypothetical protein
MNHYTPFRSRRTTLLGLVVATATMLPPATSVAASTLQFSLPPGATLEPDASTMQFALPAGATLEPGTAWAAQLAIPPRATHEPAPSSIPPAPPQHADGVSDLAPAASTQGVVVGGGVDWADAGVGAGIAFGGVLLLGGVLLVVRRSGQRDPLATR